MCNFRKFNPASLIIPAFLCVLFPGCSKEDSYSDRFPPSLIYYEPNQVEVVHLSEEEDVDFHIQGRGGDNLEYAVHVSAPQIGLVDTLVANSNRFTFFPSDFKLCWPYYEESVPLNLKMTLMDGDFQLDHTWDVVVEMVPGAKFQVVPPDTNLVIPAGLPVLFHMIVENVEAEFNYTFRLNSALVSNSAECYFAADGLGLYTLVGHVWWRDTDGESGDRYFTWNIEVVPGTDQMPPDRINNLRVGAGEEYGWVTIAFTPPLDNPDRDHVYRYEIRYFHRPLVEDWSSTYLGDLIPAVPGEYEARHSFFAGAVGDTAWVRVKSYDRAGNSSEWSNLASCKSAGYPKRGVVYDCETGLGLPGIRVKYGNVLDYTDGNGEFYCTNLQMYPESHGFPPGSVMDEDLHPVSEEPATPEQLGDWFDLEDYRAINDSTDIRLGMFKTDSFGLESYQDNFCLYLDHIMRLHSMIDSGPGDPPPIENTGHMIRPDYPMNVMVPDLINNGINYGELIREALATWETETGVNIFTETDVPADTDLYFYLPTMTDTSGVGVYQIDAWNMETYCPIKAGITIVANASSPGSIPGIKRVLLHELGHAIGIWEHSHEHDHIMNTMPTTNTIHPAEIYLVRCMAHIAPWEVIDLSIQD
ncbi:MAG: hypothetical protein GY835_04335 [bacterium]|nr:hypothetical protein [bacterium]